MDAGKSFKQIEVSLSKKNININKIKGILLTHEHIDHISALKTLLQKCSLKIYTSQGTLEHLRFKGIINKKTKVQIVSQDREYEIGFALVCPFLLPHDCKEGLGYVITSSEGERLAICTDLGYIPEKVKSSLKGCSNVIIESNHDIMMLENGTYPYSVKRRILSNLGHLSNQTCSEILPFLVENGTKNIVLSHLSFHNNLPNLALESAYYALHNYGIRPHLDVSVSVAPICS